jgi:hypothetical protein
MVKQGHRGYERQASEGGAQHGAFCGHVSVNETSVRIVDDTGVVVREVRVASEPEALLSLLRSPYHLNEFEAIELSRKLPHTMNCAMRSSKFVSSVSVVRVAHRRALVGNGPGASLAMPVSGTQDVLNKSAFKDGNSV